MVRVSPFAYGHDGALLVTSDGAEHTRQRKRVTPAFQQQRIAEYVETILDTIIRQIISERRQLGRYGDDCLRMLLQAQDEQGDG